MTMCSKLHRQHGRLHLKSEFFIFSASQGGFLPDMTRREAAQILGLRESAAEERIKDAHRRLMVANHPDSGGSSFIAAKVNEAKDLLLGKKGRAGSAF